MRVICTQCGIEGIGNFCSNCGSALDVTQNSISKNFEGADTSWKNRCPICQNSHLTQSTKKRLLGIGTTVSLECPNCGSIFIKKSRGYQLIRGPKNSGVFNEYKNMTLTELEWTNIAHGGMSTKKQREADIERWLRAIKEGLHKVRWGEQTQVILKKTEELVLSVPNVNLIEPRTIRTGVYGGPSIRVAKGVSIRLGAFRAEPHEELKDIDQGSIVLTTKRFIFKGSKRNINIDLRKIIALEPYSNGLGVRRSEREKMQYFTGLDNMTLTVTVEGRVYDERFSGLIMMYIIEGLVKQM